MLPTYILVMYRFTGTIFFRNVNKNAILVLENFENLDAGQNYFALHQQTTIATNSTNHELYSYMLNVEIAWK
jgi:hypothetical protein